MEGPTIVDEYDKASVATLGKSILGAQAGEMAAYTQGALIPPTPALQHAIENSTKQGLPMIAVSPSQGRFLSFLVNISRAKNVLEIGTLGGYSAIWFNEGLRPRGGKVTSVEIDPKRHKIAVENLEHAGIQSPSEAEVLLGDAMEVLPKIEEQIKAGKREKFDFVFIDANWEGQWAYFDWGVKLCSGPGSVIYVDNVVRMLLECGIVGDEPKDTSVPNLIEKVAADKRVDATLIETIGSKSYDGFLMAVVR